MKRHILSLFFILISSFTVTAEEGVIFSFKHHKGDSVSHISTVEEETYVNGYLNNRTQFINRTSTTINEVDKDGSALLHTHYMTTQNNLMQYSGKYLSWGEEDFVNIHRKTNGQLYDSDNLFLPTVQCIPSFSEKPIKPGESWEAPGMEVHDCRELFNMDDAIRIPFTATYTYSNDIESNGTTLQVINVYYTFQQQNTAEDIAKHSRYYGTTGYAKQTIYWDNQKGDIDHFDEEFQIKMTDTRGNSFIYVGVSHGEVTEYKSVNDDATVKKLQKKIDKNKLDDVTVKRGEKGLTISLENIQFEPDSNILLPSEKEKLEKIGKILKDFTNELLITGHCAERGTVSARQLLSEQRATAVADYLIQLGVRDEYHIFTQGKGSTEPIASNDTEEGRIKNRRVEIILVD